MSSPAKTLFLAALPFLLMAAKGGVLAACDGNDGYCVLHNEDCYNEYECYCCYDHGEYYCCDYQEAWISRNVWGFTFIMLGSFFFLLAPLAILLCCFCPCCLMAQRRKAGAVRAPATTTTNLPTAHVPQSSYFYHQHRPQGQVPPQQVQHPPPSYNDPPPPYSNFQASSPYNNKDQNRY